MTDLRLSPVQATLVTPLVLRFCSCRPTRPLVFEPSNFIITVPPLTWTIGMYLRLIQTIGTWIRSSAAPDQLPGGNLLTLRMNYSRCWHDNRRSGGNSRWVSLPEQCDLCLFSPVPSSRLPVTAWMITLHFAFVRTFCQISTVSVFSIYSHSELHVNKSPSC